jgi:hypothetical protein
MTTETTTAKMIYADRKVANMILGKMKKRQPQEIWELVKLPTGWQVARIQKLPAYMPPAKPAAVATPDVKSSEEAAGDIATIVLPFVKETKAWFDFAGPICEVGTHCLYKGHLIAWNVDHAAKTLTVKMPVKKAKEKGLLSLTA